MKKLFLVLAVVIMWIAITGSGMMPTNQIPIDASGYASLNAACAGAKGQTLNIYKPIKVTSAFTCDSTVSVYVFNGGSISSDYSYTISGPFDAGLYKTFTGSGAVTFAAGSVRYIHPEWFGNSETIAAASIPENNSTAIDYFLQSGKKSTPYNISTTNSASFSGYYDPMFSIGYNNTWSGNYLVNQSEPSWKFVLEADYYYLTHHNVESYLELVTSGTNSHYRPIALTADRDNPDNYSYITLHMPNPNNGAITFNNYVTDSQIYKFFSDGHILDNGTNGLLEFTNGASIYNSSANPIYFATNSKQIEVSPSFNGFTFGSLRDVNLYRAGVNRLETQNSFQIGNGGATTDSFLYASIGADIASAATITPRGVVSLLSGSSTTVQTISTPTGDGYYGNIVIFIPSDATPFGTSGNIAIATTAVPNKAIIFILHSATGKWYPIF